MSEPHIRKSLVQKFLCGQITWVRNMNRRVQSNGLNKPSDEFFERELPQITKKRSARARTRPIYSRDRLSRTAVRYGALCVFGTLPQGFVCREETLNLQSARSFATLCGMF